MIVLAMDTASSLCSAALFDAASHRALAIRSDDIGRGHAERLIGMIDDVLDEAGHSFASVKRLGVTIGPGSFTGIRVGVAAARGLALALHVPCIGVTTLEALAAGAADRSAPGAPIMAVLDARRSEFFCQVFDTALEPLTEAMALKLEETAALAHRYGAVLVGSGAQTVADQLAKQTPGVPTIDPAPGPDIVAVARIAAGREPGSPPSPLYLRSADAKPQEGFALAHADTAGRPA
jgi:tRNA threonylcarbamoyladenosine biosynthesis protein TsaB